MRFASDKNRIYSSSPDFIGLRWFQRPKVILNSFMGVFYVYIFYEYFKNFLNNRISLQLRTIHKTEKVNASCHIEKYHYLRLCYLVIN